MSSPPGSGQETTDPQARREQRKRDDRADQQEAEDWAETLRSVQGRRCIQRILAATPVDGSIPYQVHADAAYYLGQRQIGLVIRSQIKEHAGVHVLAQMEDDLAVHERQSMLEREAAENERRLSGFDPDLDG